MTETAEARRSWFGRRVERWYERDKLKPSERGGEIAALIALPLVTLFFVYHQILSTGFFTSSFGPLEMALFYLPVPLGLSVSLVRIVTEHRNPARPLETLSAISWVAAGLWLFIVFPFNFSHLGDVLPMALRFLLSWIPNIIGRAIVLVTGLVGLVNTVYVPAIYVSVRRELARHAPGSVVR